MIDLVNFTEEFEHEGQKLTGIKRAFKCEYCDQVFHTDALTIAVFLYGVFFLMGEKEGYAGINCPKCLKTQLMTADRALMSNFYSQVSLTTFRPDQTNFPVKLRYHSTGHNDPEAYGNLAGHYLFPSIKSVKGANWEYVQSRVRFETDEENFGVKP